MSLALPPSHAPTVRPGDVIAETYRLEAVVGEGAMGAVYSAHRQDNGLRVAVKVLHPRHVMRGELLSRFLREAKVASRITSPHAVEVLDVGTIDGDVPFFVMEFLEGVDLQDLVRQQGPLSLERAARLVMQACDAVAEAHRLGVVHRDLKPANLFLTRAPDGREQVKVIDFGVSKLLRPMEGTGDVTATTVVIGTPAYMAPEQMRSSRVDGRADVWSLAVTLFWLLTGRRPFEGETIVKIYEGILRGCPDVTRLRPEIPPEVDALLRRCLTWDPETRMGSADELAQALGVHAGEALPLRAALTTQVMTGDLGAAEAQTLVVDPAVLRTEVHDEAQMPDPAAAPPNRNVPRWLLALGALLLGGGGYLLGTARRAEGPDTPARTGATVEAQPTPASTPSPAMAAPAPSAPAASAAATLPRPIATTPAPSGPKPSKPQPSKPQPSKSQPSKSQPSKSKHGSAPLHPPASGKADDVWGMP